MGRIEGKADTVLSGGHVWCGLEAGSVEALAIRGGKVLAAGSWSQIESLVGPATRWIDLRGRLAMPGFHDAHMHLMSLARRAAAVDLRVGSVDSVADVVARVAERASLTEPGGWVVGGGYDHTAFAERRHPTRWDLDAVSPDHPVWLARCCGHMGVANSAALKLADIDRESPQPSGGVIVRENGEPTGLLQERAQEAMRAVMPDPTVAELVEAVEIASRQCLSHGITSVMDACVGSAGGWADVEAYEAAAAAGALHVRMTMAMGGGPDGIAEEAFAKGYVIGRGDHRLRVGPVKFFTDGSAGGCTAAMRDPYTNGDLGVLIFEDRDLDEMVAHYHHRGYQVAVHAIGDAAIDQTIQAFDRTCAEGTCSHRRHRIEHCGFVDDGHLDDMARLGLIPAPQPVFLRDFGDTYLDVLGEERSCGCYPMARWQRRGLKPAASSDTPVSDVNPFPNLHAAVTRRTSGGEVLGEDECMTMAEALSSYTENGAYACGVDDNLGSFAPGMAADIAVLSSDPFEDTPDYLLHQRADLTLIDGEVVFDRQDESG
ncbi:MAG: amidohydrolase [Rhodospirillaceae bacterium]|jgi:predicted amidohydrolase YtcJ|nr:amidohydrolase [Rhodospirillaceae bacterium]MBT7613373.1 amidohydrolase [Rhodospirillaceae bacterium]